MTRSWKGILGVFGGVGLAASLAAPVAFAGGAAQMMQRQRSLQGQQQRALQIRAQQQRALQIRAQQQAQQLQIQHIQRQGVVPPGSGETLREANIRPSTPPSAGVIASPEETQPAQIAALDEVVSALAQDGRVWTLVMDAEAKAALVDAFIQQFQRQGIRIRKSPVEYAQIIDALVQDSPRMLDRGFADVLKVVAILEYDFDNGQNPDDLAIRVLGSAEAVRKNKQRLGLAP